MCKGTDPGALPGDMRELIDENLKILAKVQGTISSLLPITKKSQEDLKNYTIGDNVGSRLLPFFSGGCALDFDSALDSLDAYLESQFVNVRCLLVQLRLRIFSNKKLRILMDLRNIRESIDKKNGALKIYVSFLKKWEGLMDKILMDSMPLSNRSYLKEGTIDKVRERIYQMRNFYKRLDVASDGSDEPKELSDRPVELSELNTAKENNDTNPGSAQENVELSAMREDPNILNTHIVYPRDDKSMEDKNGKTDYSIDKAPDCGTTMDIFYCKNEDNDQQNNQLFFGYNSMSKNQDDLDDNYMREEYSFLNNPNSNIPHLGDLNFGLDTDIIGVTAPETAPTGHTVPEMIDSRMFEGGSNSIQQHLETFDITQELNPNLGSETVFDFEHGYGASNDKFQIKELSYQVQDWSQDPALAQSYEEVGGTHRNDYEPNERKDDAVP